MTHDGRLAQRRHERRKVGDGFGVHDRDAVLERELHDHQARRVAALGVKFGVDRDARFPGDALAKRR